MPSSLSGFTKVLKMMVVLLRDLEEDDQPFPPPGDGVDEDLVEIEQEDQEEEDEEQQCLDHQVDLT